MMMSNKNPEIRLFVALASAFVWMGIAGAIIILSMGAPLGFAIFFLLLMIGGFLLMVIWQSVVRPIYIDFNDDGIILIKHSRKQRIVKWNDVRRIAINPGDNTTMIGRLNRGGGILEHGNIVPISLTFEVATALKEEYSRRFGNQIKLIYQ